MPSPLLTYAAADFAGIRIWRRRAGFLCAKPRKITRGRFRETRPGGCLGYSIMSLSNESCLVAAGTQFAMDAEDAFYELAVGALRGDEERGGFLLAQAMPALDRLVHKIMKRYRAASFLSLDDFPDVRQETVSQCLRSRASYKGNTPGELANWIKTIATRAARRMANYEERHYRASKVRPPEPPPALNSEVRRALRTCQERLRDEEPAWGAVLHCIHDLGMSERETATFLWGKESMHSTAGDYKRAAYRLLQRCLNQKGIEHA